jgi:hypothetical protein
MEEEKRSIRHTIKQRLEELSAAYRALARKSHIYTWIAIVFKVLLIIFGAFVAAGNTTIAVLGNANPTVLVIISMLIASLTGLDAWIQPERKAERQNILATNCRNKRRQAESRLVKIDATTASDDVKAKELELLDDLDQFFAEFQQQAAALKVNVVRDLPSPYSQPIAGQVKQIG